MPHLTIDRSAQPDKHDVGNAGNWDTSKQSVAPRVLGGLEDANNSDDFLGTVQSEDKNMWKIKLPLGEQEVEWRIDTGADITDISENSYLVKCYYL